MGRIIVGIILIGVSLLWLLASSDDSVYKMLIGCIFFLYGLSLLIREVIVRRRGNDPRE